MKKILYFCCAVALLASCNGRPVARIVGDIENAPDSLVVLHKLNYNRMQAVDTIKTDVDGHFNYRLKLTGNDPYFYYLYIGGKPVASLILRPGDQVSVRVPKEGGYQVEGSEESLLFKEVNERYSQATSTISSLLASVDANTPESRVREINKELAKNYVDYKRKAIEYVIGHPQSITSAVVLFQRLGENLPVFAQETDAVIFQRTLDSLSLVYPKSEYVAALREEVENRSRSLELATRLDDVDVISFPNLEMPDIDGNVRKLSDLEGKVIILSFWSVSQTEHKMFNVDLADIYSRYHERGLEIYQVSLDVDKPAWASTVRSQGLPWINVNDGLGIQSQSVLAYNVDHIPSMYIIDRSGDLQGRDIFDKDELEKAVKKLL